MTASLELSTLLAHLTAWLASSRTQLPSQSRTNKLCPTIVTQALRYTSNIEESQLACAQSNYFFPVLQQLENTAACLWFFWKSKPSSFCNPDIITFAVFLNTMVLLNTLHTVCWKPQAAFPDPLQGVHCKYYTGYCTDIKNKLQLSYKMAWTALNYSKTKLYTYYWWPHIQAKQPLRKLGS